MLTPNVSYLCAGVTSSQTQTLPNITAMSEIKDKLAEFGELLKIEHSLFALPFAFMGAFLAAGGLPNLWTCGLVALAMFFARTAGMSFNRVLDAKIDRENPRTSDRAVAAGRVSALSVWSLAIGSLVGLSFVAYLLNPLAFALSPLCHLLLFGYSLMKRFTWGCHIFLGLVEAFAPLGGWIAVKGTCNEATPFWLACATITWIGGMDIVYATQDAEYDRSKGLHSIPARFGLVKSFYLARALHVVTMLLLIGAGMSYGAGWGYGLGCVVVAGLFIYQHSLVSPHRNERLNFAFFGVNSWIAFVLMLSTLLETSGLL
jgi:4-hydroxybenzoate polyprenyltransferase